MQFAYQGDHEETAVFGLLFPRGAPVEVTDERAARKLSNNRDFAQVVDGVEVMPAEPKRRGRPPKAS
jgi:hypothetical protein